jgi:hypothetical protein
MPLITRLQHSVLASPIVKSAIPPLPLKLLEKVNDGDLRRMLDERYLP